MRDRREAGIELAGRLARLQLESPLVVALPRGGVAVGIEVALRLHAPLDILVVRKIGAPDDREYGLGAMVEDGTYSLDEGRVRAGGYSSSEIGKVIHQELAEMRRRTAVYRKLRPLIARRARTVILVDDGAATGGTITAAIHALREQGAHRVVVALGVAPPDTCERLERDADELVVLCRPINFSAVGQFYEQFDAVEDEEVLDLLRRAPTFPVAEP